MKKIKKIIIWLVVIGVVFAVPIVYFKHKKPVTSYTTADVTKGKLEQTVSVTGEIKPETQFDLAFKISGILNKIATVGSEVSANSEIASLDKNSLRLQFEQSQKDIEFQKKTLASMKRNTDVYNKDQRAAQKSLVEKSQVAQSLSLQNIKDASIYSPVSGVITANNFEIGEMIPAGNAALSVMTKNLIITSKVPESDIVKVQVGQHAKITFDALTQDDIFDAEVIQIDPASTTIQDVVYYNIKLKLNSADQRIKPGMSANIDIATAEKEGIVVAPLRAIKTEDTKKYVDVLQADNMTRKVYVQTGLEGDEGMVEVKTGLSGGEKVVTFSQTK